MPKLNPPEALNFNNPSEWTDWRQRFARFRMASKLDKEEGEKVQISTLIYCMGKEAEHIFTSFVFENEEDRDRYEPVLQKFQNYSIPKRNIVHERAKFHHRMQGKSETVEQYVRCLYELAKHCNFTDKSEHIRDQIVIGIQDRELSEKLQLMPESTLDKAIKRARQSEQVKQQIKDQSGQQHVEAVSKTQYRGHGQSRGRGYSRSNSNRGISYSRPGRGRGRVQMPQVQHNFHHYSQGGRNRERCKSCNLIHTADFCFAKGKRCHKCHKFDHFAVCCRRNLDEIEQTTSSDSVYTSASDGTDKFLGSVTICDNTDAWEAKLSVHGKDLNFKIDSGADTSVINEHTYRFLGKPKLSKSADLYGPGGKLDCLGVFTGETQYNGKTYLFPIHVVISAKDNLLGRSAASSLGLVKRIDGIESTSSVFGTFGLLKCEPVKVTLRENSNPYCLTTVRRVPFPLMSKVSTALNQLEQEGIIQKVSHPTQWCAPMVPVIKRDGNVRICVDLKKLNEAVMREHFMLPNLDDIAPNQTRCQQWVLSNPITSR